VENNCQNNSKKGTNNNIQDIKININENKINDNTIKLQEEEPNTNEVNNSKINNNLNKIENNKKSVNNPQFIVNKAVNSINNNDIINNISSTKQKSRTRFFSFDDESNWGNLNLKRIELSNRKVIIDNYDVKQPEDIGFNNQQFLNNNPNFPNYFNNLGVNNQNNFLNTNSNNNNDNQNFNNFNNNKKTIYTSPEDSMKKINNNTINTSSIKYKKNKKLINNHNNSCSSISYNNIYLNTLNNSTINNFNFGNLTGRISSPSKTNIINKFKTLSSYRSSSISNYHHNKMNNSMDNNDNTIKINKIYNKNISLPTITLKTLKELISEIYQSKTLYDKKCIENHLPRETMEQHMYTYLNKKYGLKKLVIDWARNIINGIKIYSKIDSIVFLFGKIMRNEQEENARFILEKIIESIDELLLFYIKQKKPLKNKKEILKLFEEKKKFIIK
jgi:hypothetical protein